jgi:hypothetical protein
MNALAIRKRYVIAWEKVVENLITKGGIRRLPWEQKRN